MSKTLNELREFLSNQALHRYNHLKDFNQVVSDFLGFNVEFDEMTKETWFTDDRIGVNLSLDDNEIYLDVFYIVDNDGNMVISEYSIDSEKTLTQDDYNKKIKGVQNE